MKHIFLALSLFVGIRANSQNKDGDSKLFFNDAKDKLESLLNTKENANYENAIFIIENAWYDNEVDKVSYDTAMDRHIANIKRIYESNYDESAIKQKANLLLSKQQIIDNYKKALTNWAIYTYMTSSTLFESENDIYYHKPYSYSKADPMASNDWKNTQVLNLNNTKQGNCFALASMFKIFSDRLNSGANLCTAPSHINIRHADEKGKKYNVELASNAFPGTGLISAVTYTTNQAIENGIAQRELNNNEAIALCLVYLAKGYEHKFNNMTDEFILDCAETAIKYDKKCLSAMLLKAEYLERKLLAKNKSIIQLKNEIDFIELQNILSSLYSLGYREMPNDMKVKIINSYQGKENKTELPHLQTEKGRYATLSWGLYDERHTKKPIETYGRTSFDTRSKKITKLVTDVKLIDNYFFDPVVFAWNIEPLTYQFPNISPYCFVEDNPIRYMDPDGRKLVDPNGKRIGIYYHKDGSLGFSKNATSDIKRFARALNLTTEGRTQLKKIDGTDIKVKVNISPETKVTKKEDGKVASVHGETVQGNLNEKENYGHKVNPDGTYGITEATITIYEGSIKNDIKEGSNSKYEGLTLEEGIGAAAGHEGIHATDKKEIDKDLKAEQSGNKRKDDGENKPNKVEDKIIEQSKKQN